MRKKIISFASVLVCASLFIGSSTKAATDQTKRLWGNDRYQTCSQIVNEGWQSSEYAVLVNGENFPDALSASVLAKKYNAPILLTQKNNLDSNTQDQLKRLSVKKVLIVGGPGVISSVVQGNLESMGIEVQRFYGADRNETSVAVAKQIGTDKGVILTTDSDYTDALSVAPIAAKLQIPIILVPKDSIPNSVGNFISGKNIIKTYVLGGEDIISENIASKFPNVQRIDGDDKYIRNFNIITSFPDDVDFKNVILASANNFPDALSGSAFAALNGNPIILMGNKSNYYIDNLIGTKGTKNVYILGGQASVNDNVVSDTINKANALDTIKSKVKIGSDLYLGVIDDLYSYEGSKYYTVILYSQRNGMWLDAFYPYNFLVNIETGEAFKLETETNKITPLENMEIGNN